MCASVVALEQLEPDAATDATDYFCRKKPKHSKAQSTMPTYRDVREVSGKLSEWNLG